MSIFVEIILYLFKKKLEKRKKVLDFLEANGYNSLSTQKERVLNSDVGYFIFQGGTLYDH